MPCNYPSDLARFCSNATFVYDYAQMLNALDPRTQGCGLAKLCNVECQKMASNHLVQIGSLGGKERHKDICGLLKKWRQVAKGFEAVDAFTVPRRCSHSCD